MARSPKLLRLAVCALMLGTASACGPSYRRGELVKAVQEICAAEYHYTVSARQVGRTLALSLHREGILQQTDNQIELAPSANEILGNLIETIHRVVLSADEPIQFYLLLVSDPKVPGAYVTVARYVDDVRRANASIIPPTELFLRTIFELKFVGTPTLSLDQLILNDIQLGPFLSWQLSRRIQTHLTEQLQRHDIPVAEIGQCTGEFRNGEFVFTLNVAPQPGAAFNDAQLQQIFQDAATVIAQVLARYRFTDFTTVRLIHPPTGRNLLLPKTRLEIFR